MILKTPTRSLDDAARALGQHGFQLQSTRGAQPESGAVVGAIDRADYRKRHFARVCKKAGLGPRRPKDLRDTFASQLLTAGVQLGYVSLQLGHADMAVTAKHYGRWAGTEYRAPVALREGELPCDLMARLEDTAS